MKQYAEYNNAVEAMVRAQTVPVDTGHEIGALVPGARVIALLDRPAPWLLEARDAIERLLTLGKDWDSYGANTVDRDAVEQALNLASFLATVQNVCAPVVTATPDGDVGFCWDTGDWSLDASIDRTGLVSYVFLDERDSAKEREGRTRNPGDLIGLLTRW